MQLVMTSYHAGIALPLPFSVSLHSLRSWRSSDNHSRVYLVIRLLAVLGSLAHDLVCVFSCAVQYSRVRPHAH